MTASREIRDSTSFCFWRTENQATYAPDAERYFITAIPTFVTKNMSVELHLLVESKPR